MYKGYNLKINNDDIKSLSSNSKYNTTEGNYNVRNSMEETRNYMEENISNSIEDIINQDGAIDTSQLMKQWFPQVEADVFISHSHDDEETAILLAEWLYQTFGLKSFIDSTVWKYAPDLLRKLDDRYCYNKSTKTYDYQLRNYTTNHVHLMLASSLSTMIDDTECLFFLNTPASITLDNTINNQTNSPWIYYELLTSNVVKRKKPTRILIEQRSTYAQEKRDLPKFDYEPPMSHLEFLTVEELITWKKDFELNQLIDKFKNTYGVNPLDILYKI